MAAEEPESIKETAWGGASDIVVGVPAAPLSHPIVREPEHQTKAAEAQKAESLKNFSFRYPKYDKTWWDAKNNDIHKFKNYSNRQETIDYYWFIGQVFKDGTIDVEALSKGQKLALYGIS